MRSTATFDIQSITSAGNDDVFVVAYDSNGNTKWAKRGGGTDRDDPFGVATDTSGNIYITGRTWSATSTFGTQTLTLSGAVDMFLVKLK